MIDLFPAEAMQRLRAKFGTRFEGLDYVERIALALAASEGAVNHARLRAITTEHPVDLSKILQHLTQNGLLESTGGRGAIHHLPGESIPTPEDVFGPPTRSSTASSPNLKPSSPNLKPSYPNLEPSYPNLEPSLPNLTENRDPDGCLLAEQLHLSVVDDLDSLSPSLRLDLESRAAEPRSKGRLSREVLEGAILAVCADRFVTLRSLAELLRRKPETLREQYLTKLVRERRLILAFPTTPTHEKQAYTTHTHTQ